MRTHKSTLIKLSLDTKCSDDQLKIINEALAADIDKVVQEVADEAALKWFSEHGKHPVDSKAYKDLVTGISNAIFQFSSNTKTGSYEISADYLRGIRDDLLKRRNQLTGGGYKHCISERAELDKQIAELGDAITLLRKA